MKFFVALLFLVVSSAFPKMEKVELQLDSPQVQPAPILPTPAEPLRPAPFWPFRKFGFSHFRRPVETTEAASEPVAQSEFVPQPPSKTKLLKVTASKSHLPSRPRPEPETPKQRVHEGAFKTVQSPHHVFLMPVRMVPVHVPIFKGHSLHASYLVNAHHLPHHHPAGQFFFYEGNLQEFNFGSSATTHPVHQHYTTSTQYSTPKVILLSGNNVIALNSKDGSSQQGKITQVYQVKGNSGISFNYPPSAEGPTTTSTPIDCNSTETPVPTPQPNTNGTTSPGVSPSPNETSPLTTNATTPSSLPTSTEFPTLPVSPSAGSAIHQHVTELKSSESESKELIIVFEESNQEVEVTLDHSVQLVLEKTSSENESSSMITSKNKTATSSS